MTLFLINNEISSFVRDTGLLASYHCEDRLLWPIKKDEYIDLRRQNHSIFLEMTEIIERSSKYISYERKEDDAV